MTTAVTIGSMEDMSAGIQTFRENVFQEDLGLKLNNVKVTSA